MTSMICREAKVFARSTERVTTNTPPYELWMNLEGRRMKRWMILQLRSRDLFRARKND
jgi:hypothetical protein